MTIVGMLLLVLSVSCRKADTNGQAVGDTEANKEAIADIDAEDKIVTPLEECEVLLDEARKTGFVVSDIEAATEAWDKAADGLQNHMYTVDQARWLTMNSEVKQARAKLAAMKARQKKDH